MSKKSCNLPQSSIGSFNNKSGDLMYGGYCQGAAHNSINMGLQTYRPNINTCQNSISIGVDSGSTMTSSSEDECGLDNNGGKGTGNISIGTRSGQHQHNPSIAIGYGVGSYSDFPQQQNSLSIQNDGSRSKISKHSLGLGTGNVPNLGENSIFIGTGSNRNYEIHENTIVLSSSASGKSRIPYLSPKQMGKDNEGFFVDTIRVNPTNNIPSDSVPLVYSRRTGEIYATHSNPPPSPSCVQKYGQCGGSNWKGKTTCCGDYVCQVQNPYYSQCL